MLAFVQRLGEVFQQLMRAEIECDCLETAKALVYEISINGIYYSNFKINIKFKINISRRSTNRNYRWRSSSPSTEARGRLENCQIECSTTVYQ